MAVPTVNLSQCQGNSKSYPWREQIIVVPGMQQKHFNSYPDQTGHARSRIKTTTNEQSWTIENAKPHRIHVLCDDVVLFCPRSNNLSPVRTGTAFLFLSNAIRVNTSSKKLQYVANRVKEGKTEGKNDLASFLCSLGTKTRPKAPEKT